jgi:hypothetical protein
MLDTPASTSAMFGQMIEVGVAWLADQDIHIQHEREYLAVLVAMQMGMFLMADQISAAIGTDVTTPNGHLRMMRGAIEVFANPLLAGQEDAIRAAINKLIDDTPETLTPPEE